MFWGGGTVALATASDNFHVLKCKPSDKFEEGTVAFLDIIALKHGINLINSLGGMKRWVGGWRARGMGKQGRWGKVEDILARGDSMVRGRGGATRR